MRDNQIYAAIIPYIRTELAAQNIPLKVSQSYQPTLQAIDVDTADGLHAQAFITKISERNYAFPWVNDEFNGSSFDESETQLCENVYQFQVLARQNPADTTAWTSGDFCQSLRSIVQSAKFVSFLNTELNGMGVLRVQDLPAPQIVDDKDNYESAANFQFTLNHKRVTISDIPSATTIEADIYRV